MKHQNRIFNSGYLQVCEEAVETNAGYSSIFLIE